MNRRDFGVAAACALLFAPICKAAGVVKVWLAPRGETHDRVSLFAPRQQPYRIHICPVCKSRHVRVSAYYIGGRVACEGCVACGSEWKYGSESATHVVTHLHGVPVVDKPRYRCPRCGGLSNPRKFPFVDYRHACDECDCVFDTEKRGAT